MNMYYTVGDGDLEEFLGVDYVASEIKKCIGERWEEIVKEYSEEDCTREAVEAQINEWIDEKIKELRFGGVDEIFGVRVEFIDEDEVDRIGEEVRATEREEMNWGRM